MVLKRRVVGQWSGSRLASKRPSEVNRSLAFPIAAEAYRRVRVPARQGSTCRSTHRHPRRWRSLMPMQWRHRAPPVCRHWSPIAPPHRSSRARGDDAATPLNNQLPLNAFADHHLHSWSMMRWLRAPLSTKRAPDSNIFLTGGRTYRRHKHSIMPAIPYQDVAQYQVLRRPGGEDSSIGTAEISEWTRTAAISPASVVSSLVFR